MRKRGRGPPGIVLISLVLASCAPSTLPAPPAAAPTAAAPAANTAVASLANRMPPADGVPAPVEVLTQAQTLDLENSDRIARFRRLARLDNIEPPIVEQVYAPRGSAPGIDRAVPVVRVVFDEGVFFDTDSATPLPQSIPVIDLIAQNMKRDVPDAALTILGHTDSTGTDAYNMRLSALRALHVMRLLAARGVDPLQMTTVAIGPFQPIAPNATPEGRARNRRVEFLISANTTANLAVVQHRRIDADYLKTGPDAPATVTPKPSVEVYQTRELDYEGSPTVGLVGKGVLELPTSPAPSTAPHKLAPPPVISMKPASKVSPAPLSDIVVD